MKFVLLLFAQTTMTEPVHVWALDTGLTWEDCQRGIVEMQPLADKMGATLACRIDLAE